MTFYAWVAELPITDDPRGDFVGDTRMLTRDGRDPEDYECRMCAEARGILDTLKHEFAAKELTDER